MVSLKKLKINRCRILFSTIAFQFPRFVQPCRSQYAAGDEGGCLCGTFYNPYLYFSKIC